MMFNYKLCSSAVNHRHSTVGQSCVNTILVFTFSFFVTSHCFCSLFEAISCLPVHKQWLHGMHLMASFLMVTTVDQVCIKPQCIQALGAVQHTIRAYFLTWKPQVLHTMTNINGCTGYTHMQLWAQAVCIQGYASIRKHVFTPVSLYTSVQPLISVGSCISGQGNLPKFYIVQPQVSECMKPYVC